MQEGQQVDAQRDGEQREREPAQTGRGRGERCKNEDEQAGEDHAGFFLRGWAHAWETRV